ncbi:MAG: hypothetical protein ACFB12_02395 [Leptolyngbyaceae cyanobacterium]
MASALSSQGTQREFIPWGLCSPDGSQGELWAWAETAKGKDFK